MRGGSSINNMLNGDAEKSLLTLANLQDRHARRRRSAAPRTCYLLMLNPYFLMRTIVLFLGDAVREVWQGWQQKRKDVQPRLNRLHHGYPFVRAAMHGVHARHLGQPGHPGHHARRAVDLRAPGRATTRWRTTPARGPSDAFGDAEAQFDQAIAPRHAA